jgi:hypothetical protein
MKLIELIRLHSFAEVKERLCELYESQVECIDNYEDVYADLMDSKYNIPYETDFVIHITHEGDYELYATNGTVLSDDENTRQYIPKSRWNDEQTFSIAMSDWHECLWMKIHEDTLHDYTEVDIICHLLFEITFYGWSCEEISNVALEIMQDVNDIKATLV